MPTSRTRQAGFTLVELLVVVLMIAIIGAATVQTFLSSSEATGRVDDDVRGQQDLRIVTEALTRDLRAARGVHDSSGANLLSVWIDSDADYVKDAAEIVVWDVIPNVADAGHFDVRRKLGSQPPAIMGRSVIDALAFRYFRSVAGVKTEIVPTDTNPATADAALKATNVVEVSMDYDAIIGAFLDQKTNTYQIRLRNAE